MARTFHQMTGNGSDFTSSDPYVASSPIGYQDFEWARQAIDIAMYLPVLPLGGSESAGKVTGAATWVPVTSYLPHTLNGDNLGGLLVVEAVVCRLTENASGNVQVRIRNVTDSTTAGTGVASSSTTPAEETISVTLASGVKQYRLEMTGDATYACAAWGYLRIRCVPV